MGIFLDNTLKEAIANLILKIYVRNSQKKDVQKSAVSTLFHFARIKADHHSHMYRHVTRGVP